MDATATTVTRYAYVSSVTDTTVVYGGNVAADTSDGTALDVSKPIRIYVPLRAGHVVRVVNSLVQVDKDHLVSELVYDEGNGATFASLSTIGQNDSAVVFRPNVLKQVSEQGVKYGQEPADTGGGASGQNFGEQAREWTMNGELYSSTVNQVNWAKHNPDGSTPSGNFVLNDGFDSYNITAGNSGTMTGEHTLYFDPSASSTTFSTQLAKDFIESKTKLKIATMALVTTPAEAVYEIATDVGTTGGSNTRIKALPEKILSPANRIISGDGTAAAPTFSFTSDPNSGMYQYADDQVAISVAGTARFITTASGIYATTSTTSGTNVIVTAGGLFAKDSSSIRYKDNVETLDFDYSKLDSLRPVSYNYKFDNAPDIGLIAEEVNEVYPELINYNEEGKPESVKYKSLSVILLNEVTKLRQEVNELKKKN